MADWKQIVGAVAPGLATVLGGPLAGGVVSMLADKLLGGTTGDPVNDEAKIAGMLAGGLTPELRARIIDTEAAFRIELLKADLRRDELVVEDRKDARGMQVANKSFMPAVLTAAVVGAFVSTLGMLFFIDVPQTNRDLVVYMIGQLSGGFTSGLAFWWGTTRSSENKTNLLAQATPVK